MMHASSYLQQVFKWYTLVFRRLNMALPEGYKAELLSVVRGRRGMPIATLAERAQVARGTVYAAEAGKLVRLAPLLRMAGALEVPLAEISPDAAKTIEAVA
jgi:DNA-binding XRE family transcriptional regulator